MSKSVKTAKDQGKDYKALYLNLSKRIGAVHRVANALSGPHELFERRLDRRELGLLLEQIAFGRHSWSR